MSLPSLGEIEAQEPAHAKLDGWLATRERESKRENENGPRRSRTCDPLIKSQLLYQLS